MKQHSLYSACSSCSSSRAVCPRRGQFDRTLTVSGPVNLDLTTGSGEVVVKTGGSSQVVIHGTVRSSNDWFGGDCGERRPQRRVQSPDRAERQLDSHWLQPPRRRQAARSISYEITVPADTTLQASSGSGEISAEGVRAPVKLHTGSGDIRAQRSWATVHMETGSGSIRADSVAAPFSASTGSGEIEADLTGSGDVDVHTGLGQHPGSRRQWRLAGTHRQRRTSTPTAMSKDRGNCTAAREASGWRCRPARIQPGCAHRFGIDSLRPANHGSGHARPSRVEGSGARRRTRGGGLDRFGRYRHSLRVRGLPAALVTQPPSPDRRHGLFRASRRSNPAPWFRRIRRRCGTTR